jgi:hypothetical protein
MALDGIVRMVDALFRQWDDTEKVVGVRARTLTTPYPEIPDLLAQANLLIDC